MQNLRSCQAQDQSSDAINMDTNKGQRHKQVGGEGERKLKKNCRRDREDEMWQGDKKTKWVSSNSKRRLNTVLPSDLILIYIYIRHQTINDQDSLHTKTQNTSLCRLQLYWTASKSLTFSWSLKKVQQLFTHLESKHCTRAKERRGRSVNTFRFLRLGKRKKKKIQNMLTDEKQVASSSSSSAADCCGSKQRNSIYSRDLCVCVHKRVSVCAHKIWWR